MTKVLLYNMLRELLSRIMVNSHIAFHLIPLKTNIKERKKINQIMILCEEIGSAFKLNIAKEIDEIIDKEFKEFKEEIGSI